MVQELVQEQTSVKPKRNETSRLPLTPPATVEKKQTDENANIAKVSPKKLLPQLKKSNRKPRLKYRPDPFSVFHLNDYLDGLDGDKDADFVRYALRHSKRIVTVAGAGISVAAGIPDFRSKTGLFKSLSGKKSTGLSSGKDLFDFNQVYSCDEMSIKFNGMITDLHRLAQESQSTAFHSMLNEIAAEGRLQRLYTQNIDGLDTRLTHLNTKIPLEKPAPVTIQLHGSINHVECNMCSKIDKLDPSIFKCNSEDTTNGTQVVPTCSQCEEYEAVRMVAGLRSKGVGKLRPRVVLYNEMHPEGDLIGEITSHDIKKKPDCLIVVGTSLQIPGVKQLCKQFVQTIRARKGIVLYLNKDLPSQSVLDSIGWVDLIVLGDCQDVSKLL
ncbi:ZYRO0C04246p [Zygosaccharomyces rouxii]|uniref:ZYRO0C04246p n=1 Tax=Zygosaccharomyces rouxii (strain ATCC 2623 / CBS 732 / NBRC 1130 / NCYC 568 / NRRL Y-229) TaxID=559307 RepID=C5DSZ8_ZYGRC|nr:uncharacterized protein ZYRO0C04246g [Zygosaccharomyces rouxii]KAH9201902.1 DHS-like NAD/FAD-binding domain-containing protein [Zygosaccharomyces rouxii]CAR26909.1 ZYRO0C04246p [Zygosaccharomyces rouxii]